jgi:hypothetical protein
MSAATTVGLMTADKTGRLADLYWRVARDELRNPLATLAVAVSTLNRRSHGGIATRAVR